MKYWVYVQAYEGGQYSFQAYPSPARTTPHVDSGRGSGVLVFRLLAELCRDGQHELVIAGLEERSS